MDQPYASGNWHVTAGKEGEFIKRWSGFLDWTRGTQPGLITAGLLRDAKDPAHFVSFAEWKDEASREAWRASDGFPEHFAAVRALCDDMYGSDYARVVSV